MNPVPNRKNRVEGMMRTIPKTLTPGVQRKMKEIHNQMEKTTLVKPSLLNRILRVVSNTPKVKPSIRTMKGGRKRLTEYQLRALSELSYRSPKVVQSNLKTLRNKTLAKRLRTSIHNTRKRR